ncbi:MAG: hypothetical protein ACFCGT_26715 [Sandaracinaceae bacterium]
MRDPFPSFRPLLLLALLTATAGCSPKLIAPHDVEDTADNRQVIRFLERYRLAMESRNIPALLALVSPRYFDTNGTLRTEDDRDFDLLRQELTTLGERLLDVYYTMRYRRITYELDRILVDVTYTARFKLATPEGDRWTRRADENRFVLVTEEGELRIVSGM